MRRLSWKVPDSQTKLRTVSRQSGGSTRCLDLCLNAPPAHLSPTALRKPTEHIGDALTSAPTARYNSAMKASILPLYRSPLTLLRCVQVDMSCASFRATFQLEGEQCTIRGTIRKIIHSDSIVYLWSAESQLQDKGLTLKEDAITRICRPSSNSLNGMPVGSILQSRYVGYMVESMRTSHEHPIADKLLFAHGRGITLYMQTLSESLQDETHALAMDRRLNSVSSVYAHKGTASLHGMTALNMKDLH